MGSCMQISDKLGQYNRNVTNGSEELRGAQSMQKLVSSVGDLSTGSVFEGTVNHVRGGKAILALGNGQVITARLEGKVDVKQGTAMFFQVKSNDGTTVSIRPYNGVGNAGNPILLNALTAAQVPVTDRTLMMVDAMMQEHMSVDRKSILDMVKILNANPGANVQTIVQMTKLGMPVTEEMAAQFENYLSNQHGLLNEMELATGQIVEVFGDEAIRAEDSFALFSKVMDIFSAGEQGNGMVQSTDGSLLADGNIQNQATISQSGNSWVSGLAQGGNPQISGLVQGGNSEITAELSGEVNAAAEVLAHAQEGQMPQDASQVKVDLSGLNMTEANQQATLGSILSETQIENLAETLRSIPTLALNTDLFIGQTEEEVFVDTMQDEAIADTAIGAEAEVFEHKTVLNRDMTAGEFLRTLRHSLSENGQYGYAGVQKLFAGKEFQMLFRNMVEQQWLMTPRDVKDSEKINSLYEKMERQVNQMQAAMQAVGITENSFLQTAADIRGNIEFMNQMNQIYNYIQLPLKMSGQNANGELYVYTNKKQLRDPDAELTAFLHLDMEHLGSTDVSVRMVRKQVKTNFYFEDDASYDIVEKHLPILEKRLKNKGYNCTITITNEKKDINFKESFVKKGSGSVGGSVHRYSFDVRA